MKTLRLLILLPLFIPAAAQAAPGPGRGPSLLDAVVHMRMKQEGEESVVRVIQMVPLQQENICSPVQQSRSRLETIGEAKNDEKGEVTVTAGHGEVTISDNSGTVDNSVSVQIVNQNENGCL